MMKLRDVVLAVLLVIVAAVPARAHDSRISSTFIPPCVDGFPWTVVVLDAGSATDCDNTPSGSVEVECRCLDGVIAAVTSGGASIVFDIGDDGGNDSTALAEISTVGDDYNAVTESSANEAQFDFSKIYPFRQYDPDRPPTNLGTGGWREDWTGDTEAVTWAWSNQDSAVLTVEYDTARIFGETTNDEYRQRMAAAVANVDQTFTAKLLYVDMNRSGSPNNHCGIIAFFGNTLAAPTNIHFMVMGDFASDSIYYAHDTNSDFSMATGITTVDTTTDWSTKSDLSTVPIYLQMRYTDTNRVVSTYYSFDGMYFTLLASTTNIATADPIYWGFTARDEAGCRVYWAQLRTDANRNQTSE